MHARIPRIGALLVAALGVGSARAAAPLVEPSAALAVDTAYDSNVFNGRGPDLVIRITPHVSLRLREPRFTLRLAYDLGVWIYATGTAKDSINHFGDVALDARVTRRLTLHLGDQVIYAGDPGFLLRAGVVAPQTSIFDNTADGLLAYRFTRRVDGTLGYTYRHTTFGAPPPGAAPLFNGDEHDAIATLAMRASRRDDLRLAYRFQYFTVDTAGLAIAHAPSVGWRRRFLTVLELRLEAGPLFYQLLEEGERLFPSLQSGVTWRGAGVLRYASGPLRAALSFTRDLVGGTGAATVLWVDWLYAQAGYRLARRLDVHAGVGYFANGFAPDEPRSFDGVAADALAEVTIVDGVRVAVYYQFRWQEAFAADPGLAPLPSITRHIVGLRLFGVIGAEARPPRMEVHE